MMEDKLWNRDFLKCCAGNFLLHLSFTLIVPLLPLYLHDTFGATKDTIGMALAGYTLMAILVRPFSGYMVDSFSRRTVLLVCNFLFAAAFVGYLVAGSLTLFTIFRTLHGAPFGATTVAINTVTIDVLPASRRTEGIGYYGLSTNLATAIGPVVAIFILDACGGNYNVLFTLSLLISIVGLINDSTIHHPKRDFVPDKKVISLDRFFLLKAWPEALSTAFCAMSYGVISTYVAIYGRQSLGITSGTGFFFTLFAIGLIISRLTGAKSLRRNLISRNCTIGVIVAMCGYLLFAAVKHPVAYYASAFIIGLGNGHMFPAFQNMFINLAEHNQRGTATSSILTSWDAGVGLGVLFGGLVAENVGYSAAFYMAFAVNAIGVIYFVSLARKHFETNKLR